jgi:transcriptional regulator with XRE-family HTH domain
MQVESMGRIPAVVPGARSPVVRRRELGVLLRTLRTEAGMTVEDVAKVLLCSPSKVSRMETGQRAVSQRDIRDLCQLYQVTGSEREHLTALAKGQREQAWWQPYDLPFTLATYVGLEAEAVRISDYQPGVIPGLLQTPGYARAVHEGSIPRLSDPEIDERIQVRQSRQAILTREDPPPPQYRVIIDEAALHRIVGGPAVMIVALERIIEATKLPNVAVQILAYEAGAHPALDSTFIVLEFTDPVPTVVYVEGLVGQLYLEKPHEAKRYEQIFQHLQGISCSERESVDFFRRLIKSYKTPLRYRIGNR